MSPHEFSPETHRPPSLPTVERILYLFRIFEGAQKLAKLGRPGGRIFQVANVALLKTLLDHLGLHYHAAPGEAEAESSRLNELGVVDVVWSEDSDCFMFGTGTLIQFHRPEGQEFKSGDAVLVYTAERVRESVGLSNHGFLMYTVLVGCDYADGLPGIGPAKFAALATHAAIETAADAQKTSK